MSNYKNTTEPGSIRRRAKQIIINNPAEGQPSVTFVREDRVILANGSSMFMPVDNMVIAVNEDTLNKLYPNYDVETGEVVESKGNRYGATILNTIMDALEDVFITEGIVRDTPPSAPEAIPDIEPGAEG